MPLIAVQSLVKTFATRLERVQALQETSFEVAAGEMVTLLGPSGCGKTTSLRCVAGLERPDGGTIRIGDRKVVDVAAGVFVPPHLRRLGMVFQSYAIWPHMTVFDNVAYALEGQHLNRDEVRRRTREALQLVHLEHLADRPAPRLSGGQQQRVAIARALAGRPEALLFDEPLSNLDAKLREEMRTEIRSLQQRVGLTSIYVTHDQSEALAISDWVIVMKDGRIIEKGRPRDIYRRPQSVFTARFIGSANLIPGSVTTAESPAREVWVDTSCGQWQGVATGSKLQPGNRVQICVRPEDLELVNPSGLPDHGNRLEARVALLTFTGSSVLALLKAGDLSVHCQFGRDIDVAPGTTVLLAADPNYCIVLPDLLDAETDAARLEQVSAAGG